MECSSSQDDFEETYKVLHFFRNECSNILAQLLVKELRNSNYVKGLLESNREGTLSMSLFRLLKTVSSKGKKKASKKSQCTTEEPGSFSKTQHLNNLKYNEDDLAPIQIGQMLLEEGETVSTVERLSNLDSAFLLWILTNEILEFPHTQEVNEALATLREIRNSIYHRDSYKNSNKSVPELLDQLCTMAKFLCQYLGKDDAYFQSYMSYTPSSFSPIFRELQQEIYNSYLDSILRRDSYHHQIVQPTIKHIRGDCRSDEIVENLVNFLAENQVRVSEEPRPVLLCGAAGAGKTSTLHCLTLTVIHKQCSDGSFPLVVRVDEIEMKYKTREEFWKCLFKHLAKLCPQAEKKYGQEEVVSVLSSYSNSNSFLFLMDQNIQGTRSLNSLMPYMDRGTWVLSYRGVPDPSNFYRVLKMESLSEGQVNQLLSAIIKPKEQCNLVSQLYERCDYKGLIDTPDMVCIFAKVCLEIQSCDSFYRLIQIYIYKNIPATDENETELIKLGKKAFHTIKLNKKYYEETSLNDIADIVWRLFLEPAQSKRFFFKYRVVEDYLAAKYVVKETEVACESWLKQATLFKRVFEIVCAFWCKEEDGIKNNLPYIRKYLQKLFEIGPHKTRRKKRKEEAMETDEIAKDNDHATNQNNFVRWNFLSKLAKDNQNNQDILLILAELLACKNSWLFKCKSVTEKCLDNLSLVFRHIKLTKELTIKLESGPNVAMLTKLWGMLSDHEGVCSNTTVQLVIHYTETNWIMHEKFLTMFPATVAQTTAPLYITKYVGPLLCSGTEQFLKCLCMQRLEVLDAYVCDFGSLREVLEHRQKLRSVVVRLNFRVAELEIPNIMIKLSSSFPLNLTIAYFEGLQALLDKIESPRRLSSLRIYRVYIHEGFHLDLSRFSKLEFLSIKFVHMGKLPSHYLLEVSEEKMEVDDIENKRKVSRLPLEQWALQLVLNLHLPARLGRLLLRNLSFCDDTNIPILNRYWRGLPFQRLVLLDTHLSMSKFKEILQSLVNDSKVDDVRESLEKRCRLEEEDPESLKNAMKQERLVRQERENKRRHKPEGKEVIITSDAKLCSECHLLSCTCVQPSISHSRDTYHDFVTLVNDIYSYEILSISYNSKDIILRKDLCGDLHVQCPLAFLNDEMAERLESANPELLQGHRYLQELSLVLGALALAQAISLTHTHLSHKGALCLLKHLKKKKQQFGSIEPFRLTIFSRYYHTCSKSVEEMRHSPFTREIQKDDSLQQFNFRCNCMKRCHNFKKSINGTIYFNDVLFNGK